jgi:Domain of unknown function (DUF5666)
MKTAVIALVVLVGILGGFYGGYKVGQNNVSANTTASSGTRGNGGQFAGRGGLTAACPSPGATPSPGSTALARGTISNLSSTSMTLAATGCDVKVTFSPTTSVSKTVAGSTSDLLDNQTVTVTGTRQADGSILAQAIQVGGAGGRVPGTGANPSAGG